ncbi:hypothetical protein ABZ714_12515 [Streptomyces sp. NPDC006798]|uniref:hypothetical protein n=1 Tax=Streptomyces sp. NPDC006798 TaxID=3155462 RepID=UPI0033EF5C9E
MAALEGPVNPDGEQGEGQGVGEDIPVDPRAELVIVLAQQGFGRNEISRRTGISTFMVSKIAQAHGVEFDRAKMEQPLKDRLNDLRVAQAGAAEGLSEDLIIARTVFRMARTPRDYAFAAKAIVDIQNSLYKAMLAAAPALEDVNEEAKSLLGDLMKGIKEVNALMEIEDEMYERGEFDQMSPSYLEQKRKREASERADREGFH